jgi:O-antigen/teichoic acid export membrane protein
MSRSRTITGPARRLLGALRRGELGGLIGDSFWVGVSQGSMAVVQLIQIALITHSLGLSAYGELALVVSVVSLSGRFFDLRVGTVVTVFAAERMGTSLAAARGIAQFGFAASLIVGAVSAVVVGFVAVVVGQDLIGTDGPLLIAAYGLTLVTGAFQDPGSALLRLLDRFRLVAVYTAVLQVLRLILIAVAILGFDSLLAVVLALVIVDGLTSAAELWASARVFKKESGGVSMFARGASPTRPERRRMLRMMWHTNLVTYGGMAQAQLPDLIIGIVAGTTELGVYKVGMSFATGLATLVQPLYGSVLPRLSRLWNAGRGLEMRRLIRHVSYFSVPAMAVLTLIVAWPLQTPLVHALGGEEAVAAGAGTVLVFGVIARGFGSAFFWNISVLWATGHSRAAAWIQISGAVLQIGLLAVLIGPLGAEGAAIAFCVSNLLLNTADTAIAVRAMRTGPPARAKEHRDVVEPDETRPVQV